MTDQLTELILLAEACGLTRALTMYPGVGQYTVSKPDLVIILEDSQSTDFRPRTNLRHAGMLTRELGIDLLRHDHEGTPYWETTDSDGRSNVSGRGEGNTEAAQCAAICDCALKILKGRAT